MADNYAMNLLVVRVTALASRNRRRAARPPPMTAGVDGRGVEMKAVPWRGEDLARTNNSVAANYNLSKRDLSRAVRLVREHENEIR